MSLTQWLNTGKIKTHPASLVGFPDPADASSSTEASVIQTANDAAEVVLKESLSRKRKRGEYGNYCEETRAKIARYAIDSGVAKASRKFTTDLGRKVSESTVRSMRDQYVKLKKKEGKDSTTLPHTPRGAPTLLGEHDVEVQDWVRKIRLNGGVVNVPMVTAAAEGILMKFGKHKLERYGGHICVTKHYGKSLLRRMGFVKRKGTKAVKNLPTDFEVIKSEFVKKVQTVITEHHIPDELIINWDQTGCRMVPGGDWTMEEQGAKQVSITGLDDKRQITILLAATKSGTLLPPQLIYAGKTERCLPKGVDFPDTWDVTYTENHWSNEASMLRYIDTVIIPYVNSVRDDLPIRLSNQQAVAIFDVFKAHQSAKVIKKLKYNGITPLFVPACCTDRLQPLDLAVNYDYKETLKQCFHTWYCNQVVDHLDSEHVDMKTSTLKPIHAKWIINTHSQMERRHALIVKGFEKAGL